MGCGMVPVDDRRVLEPASPGAAPAPGWQAFLLAARMTEQEYPGATAFLLWTACSPPSSSPALFVPGSLRVGTGRGLWYTVPLAAGWRRTRKGV